MNHEQKIAEIREALEKATAGPWKWVDPGGLEKKKLVGEWEIMNFGTGGMYDQVAGSEPDDDDAYLIANAPEWLRFLLDELEQAQKELDRLIGALKWLVNEYYKCAEIAWRKWKTEADMYEQGKNHAFDDAAQMLEALLKEHGVTVE